MRKILFLTQNNNKKMVAWKRETSQNCSCKTSSRTYSFKGKVKRDHSRSALRGWTPKCSMYSVPWGKKHSPALLLQDPGALSHRGKNAQRACTHSRTCQAGTAVGPGGEAAPHRFIPVPLNAPPRAQLGLLLPLPPFSKWEPGSLFNHNYFLFLNHF